MYNRQFELTHHKLIILQTFKYYYVHIRENIHIHGKTVEKTDLTSQTQDHEIKKLYTVTSNL